MSNRADTVAAQNFEGETVTYAVVIALIGLAILLPVTAEMGKRVTTESISAAGPT
jgi:hypothetical protein